MEKESPIMVFTILMEVHAPYVVPLTFDRKFSSRRSPKEGVTNAKGKPSEKDLKERINLYEDCIRYLDKKIGRFVEKIDDKYPDTVFIITSDHGSYF